MSGPSLVFSGPSEMGWKEKGPGDHVLSPRKNCGSDNPITSACKPRQRRNHEGRLPFLGGVGWFGAWAQVSFSSSKTEVQLLKHPSTPHRNSFKTHMAPTRLVSPNSLVRNMAQRSHGICLPPLPACGHNCTWPWSSSS